MAIHFCNGTSHKDRLPTPELLYLRAIRAAKTYSWVKENNLSVGTNQLGVEFFRCSITGIVALRTHSASPVMFVGGDLLVLTCDEQLIKDIIL